MSDKSLLLIGYFVGLIIGMIFVFVVLHMPGTKWVHKDEAVDAGHAEYYIDEDNKRQWRWKEAGR